MDFTNKQRNDAYRRVLELNLDYGKVAEYHFHVANLSLDELRQRINCTAELTEADFDHVTHRFEQAVEAAEDHGDIVDSLKTRLVMAYVKPIALSKVINNPDLTKGEARKGFEAWGLKDATEGAYEIATGTLDLYDELMAIPVKERTIKETKELREAVGLLGEITPLLVYGARHHTSKLFATPTLSFDDSIRDDGRKVDTILYDNRVTRTTRNFSFQNKTSYPRPEELQKYDPYLTILTAHEFGNDAKSKYWPTTDDPFTTIRMLMHERNGTLRPELSSTLDRIASDVFRHITTAGGLVIMEKALNSARESGAEFARFVMEAASEPDELATGY